MSREIETKIRLGDPGPLRTRLRESGAARHTHVQETNRIFDTPDRRLLAGDCGLRIRESRPVDGGSPLQPTLTFKGPREPGPLKSRAELETPVADAQTLADILQRLGFREVIRYEKRRETWRLRDCEVCLDELPRLGWYVEIEGPRTEAVETARKQLGLTALPALRETYVELAADHGDADPAGCRLLLF
ncbi:MAG TPA: class IV adenylate cyclase [Phycisphaerae bacterium]|nr:class IV adenylate cyclase [Phycisphaerae bacterium]